MKLNCIIDTCSCVYLSIANFQQKSLLKHLSDNVNINFSKEVSLEISDHKDKGLPKFIQNKKLILKPIRHSIEEYETRLIGKVLPSRRKKGNKGEIDNFVVSIDQVHHIKKGVIIFITDDTNAINGNLNIWMESFPGLKYWSSYDVVLYLYAEKVIPSKDIASDMIKDIIATSSPKGAERTLAVTKKYTNIFKIYTQRIDYISKIFN
jgi:hypothetical protein